MIDPVRIAFEKTECTLPLSKIIPQRQLSPNDRRTTNYKLISSSIRAVGIIEALVVYPKSADEYLLLDGHTRLDVLQQLGVSEVRCTLSTDDESYTFNQKVNPASAIAQHFMILKALEHDVPEERLAQALNVNIKNLRIRRNLLNGICDDAVELLRNRKVAMGVFAVLRKMKPLRQLEAVEHMIAGSTFSITFANALLAVTRPELLVKPTKKRKITATSHAAQDMLGMETQRLAKDLKRIEESYGKDLLSLTVCVGFITRLIANPRVERYLSHHHPELLEAIRHAITDGIRSETEQATSASLSLNLP